MAIFRCTAKCMGTHGVFERIRADKEVHYKPILMSPCFCALAKNARKVFRVCNKCLPKATDFSSQSIEFHPASLRSHPHPLIRQTDAVENSLSPLSRQTLPLHVRLVPIPHTNNPQHGRALFFAECRRMLLSKPDLELSCTGLCGST